VTNPEHERPFGKAMLPDGTKAFCLCSESFRSWPRRLKIYVPNIGRHQRNPRFPELGTFDCAFAAL
jgi:hypothetical protein